MSDVSECSAQTCCRWDPWEVSLTAAALAGCTGSCSTALVLTVVVTAGSTSCVHQIKQKLNTLSTSEVSLYQELQPRVRVVHAHLVAVSCAATVPRLDGEEPAGCDRHPRT